MASTQSDASPPADAPLPPVKLDPLAAVFSYLIPGLGQVYQGRIGKGLLFFCGLYLLFFYGMWMGQWRNVWLPDTFDLPQVVIGQDLKVEGTLKSIVYRPQFLGQVWIGIAAWPAIYQYLTYDQQKAQFKLNDRSLADLRNSGVPDAVLEKLSPLRNKEYTREGLKAELKEILTAKDFEEYHALILLNVKGIGLLGNYELAPTEDDLNYLQRNGSKRWDLGWVYTVIAGVLNLLVIYDALAGPMFRDPPASLLKEEPSPTPVSPPQAVSTASANPVIPAPVATNPKANPQGGTP